VEEQDVKFSKVGALAGAAFIGLAATPAAAATPIAEGDGWKLTPLIDARVRYEHVDQDNALENANALTARLRAGFELALPSGFSVLVEGEGLAAIVDDYDEFPFAGLGKDDHSVVADPENIELNRFQLQYKGLKGTTFTVGRQRINLDDQRFVGSVGWRQNEQTFDAARVESTIGPVMIDATYAWSDRTIFGKDAGTRQAFSGDNVFVTAGIKQGPVTAKGFAFLVDQDEPGRFQFSSQTYGLRASGAIPIGKAKLTLTGSYASQSDHHHNPIDYSADYYFADAALDISGFTLNANYEVLGSDDGLFAFQTPLATLHKFQGWADQFLTTPAAGVEDLNFTVSKKLPGVKFLPGLNAGITYHSYKSEFGSVDYGDEWNAQVGFNVWKTNVLVKYASYNADAFAVDVQKFWLQVGWTY
jgi:hypothetical protein